MIHNNDLREKFLKEHPEHDYQNNKVFTELDDFMRKAEEFEELDGKVIGNFKIKFSHYDSIKEIEDLKEMNKDEFMENEYLFVVNNIENSFFILYWLTLSKYYN